MMPTLRIKRGPSKNLEAAKPTLTAGEPVFTIDAGKLYIFDGTNLVMINPDQTAINPASLTVAGIVMLGSATNSTDETKAATPKAVKAAYDLAASKASINSAALTGTPTAPTAAVGTNTTQIATTAFVLSQGFLLGDSVIDGGTF